MIRAALGEVDPDLKVLAALDGIRKTCDHIPDLVVSSTDGRVQAATGARLMGKALPADLPRPRGAAGVHFEGPRIVSVARGPTLVLRAPVELAEAQVAVGDLICLIDFAAVTRILESVRVTGDRPAWFVPLDAAGRPIGLPPGHRAAAGREVTLSELGIPLDGAVLPGHTGYLSVRTALTGEDDLVGFSASRGHRGSGGLGWILPFRVSGSDAVAGRDLRRALSARVRPVRPAG